MQNYTVTCLFGLGVALSVQTISGFKVYPEQNETHNTTQAYVTTTAEDYYIEDYYENITEPIYEANIQEPSSNTVNDSQWKLDQILKNLYEENNETYAVPKKGDGSKNNNTKVELQVESNVTMETTTPIFDYRASSETSTSSTVKGFIQHESIGVTQKPDIPNKVEDTTKYNDQTLPKCPEGFTYLEKNLNYDYNNDENYNDEDSILSICYLFTEANSFPPTCPYANTIEYHRINQGFDITNQTVWALAKRNLSDGFGPFEWIKPFPTNTKTSNRHIRHYQRISGNITEKNCLVYVESKLTPAYCTDKYPGICIYRHNRYFGPKSGYCERRYNSSCSSSDLGLNAKCYCKIEAASPRQSRNTFCQKLAETVQPYQNSLLMDRLTPEEPCWLGMHKDTSGSYGFSSTNTTVAYHFWADDTNFTKPYGALSNSGWILEEDGELNCAICEVQVEDHPQVDIKLKYHKTINAIDIEISHPTEVYQGITCSGNNSHFIPLTSNEERVRITTGDSNRICNNFDYCWCTILQMPNLTPVYSNTIFFKNDSLRQGHEYAVTLIATAHHDPYLNGAREEICRRITTKSQIIQNARPLQITNFNEKEGTVEVLCHFNLNSNFNASSAEEFQTVSSLLQKLDVKVANLATIETCLPSNTTSGNTILHWPETPVGATIIPNELCLQEDGSPVVRTCAGDFYFGSFWLPVQGACADVTFSPTTLLLDGLLRSNTTTPSDLNQSLLNITMTSSDFTSFQVYLVARVLEKAANYATGLNIDDVTATVNNIMHFEPTSLRQSQELLNSTDMILSSLDDVLASLKFDDKGYTSAITNKLLVQVSDLKQTDIIGIKLDSSDQGFHPNEVNPLHQGATLDSLVEENLDLAMIIPPQLHTEITTCMGSKTAPNLIATVFYDDVLFSEQGNGTGRTDGRIISVAIPGFNCSFNEALQVIFKSPLNQTDLKCSSWVYGSDGLESIRGHWLVEGNPTALHNSSYQMCQFTHITHFSLLVLGGSHNISDGHKKALDVITAVGSGLSILGLIAVFATAIMFKSYRSSNAVLIHFSIAMTAQILVLFIADNVAENSVLCTIFGAALHYIVLSQFCWMLTIALLQYKRYVYVFSNPTAHLIAKACAFSWGVPLVPIIIIVSISPDNYGANSYGLCYALGNYFIFGVLVPVTIILLINLIIFLRIMLSITSSRKITVHQKNDDTSVLQLRLAIMLYFLLGLTWGFGLLAAIGGGIVYSYLFCITATIQGFVLFLFFIALNEKTRHLWVNMTACCRSKSRRYDVNTDSATPMMRRDRTTNSSDTRTDSTTSEMLRRYKNRKSADFD